MRNDIVISRFGLLVASSFFSFHVRAFSLEKIRSDPFHNFVFVLSQLRKVQFSLFFLFFSISILVGATAQHPQHTDDKGGEGRGKGPESKSSLILCQRKRKREQ